MTRAKSPARRKEALRLAGKGLTTREVAATLRKRYPKETFSEAWVRKVAAADPAPESEPAPASVAAAPPPVPSDPIPDLTDLYAHTQRELSAQLQMARAAAADGNHTASTRHSKLAESYTLLLARLDKDRKTDTDVVTIPRVELERARQAMRDRVTALASDIARTGGLVCNHCGREIRISLAKGDL